MLDKLQEMHAKLREAKYFYYEYDNNDKDIQIMTDYEFDMMEKEYSKLAENLKIKDEHNIAKDFVGFDIMIPMNLNNFYIYDENLKCCKSKNNDR